MAGVFQPAPTHADVVIVDELTGKPRFNPIWLDWFLNLVAILDALGGTTAGTHNALSSIQGGSASERYHLSAAQAAVAGALANPVTVATGGTGSTTARAAAAALGVPYILSQSGASVSCPADTTEDTLATITVPANALGANGVLRILTTWTFTNSANNKTMRVRYSGGAGTIYSSNVQTTQATSQVLTLISNRNATNSQVGAANDHDGLTLGSASAIVTSAVDTTASTTIVITGQKANSGETLRLERYVVELLYSA